MAEVEKIEQIARAFEEFKSKNDSVIAEEIKKGTADVVRKEEVDRINAAITDVQEEIKAARRDALFGKVRDEAEQAKDEFKSAYFNWAR